ncbi:MAG: hypothetical protein ACK5LY_04795 [Lachnospirales bacterium]
MKKFKKGLSVLLVLAVSAATITACGSSNESATGDDEWNLPEPTFTVDANTPSWKIDDSTADIDWYMGFDWFTPGQQDSVAMNYLKEDTGVNITYQSGGNDKINSLIAANNLPDVITVNEGDASLIADLEKVAIPIEVLSEKYDPYFMSTVADPEIVKFYQNADGHLYMYPNYAIPPSDYENGGVYGNEAFLVRKDIYEAIGSPDMSTPEGFLDALAKAQELGETDGTGKEVIPFGINHIEPNNIGTDVSLANMLGIPTTEDGKIIDRYTDPDFVSWMKVFAEANREGYMDPDVITLVDADRQARITNGSYFAYLNSNLNADPYTLTSWYNQDSSKAYIAVDGPASLVGNPVTYSGPNLTGWTRTFVSKTCSNPQKVMEVITYLSSEEGALAVYFGREGVDYTMEGEKAVPNQEITDLYNSDPGAYQIKYGFGEIYQFNNTSFTSILYGVEQFGLGLQQPKQFTVDYIVSDNSVFEKDKYLSSEEQRNNERIKTQWFQTFSKMITASDDAEVDSLMQEYVDFRDANGYAEIETAQNKAIAENIEKLK